MSAFRRLFCLLIPVLLAAGEGTGAAWTAWRGGAGSGAVADGGIPLIEDMSRARLVWRSEAELPDSYGGHGYMKTGKPEQVSGGYSSLALADGRLYLTFFRPAGEVLVEEPQAPPPGITKEACPARDALLKVEADEHLLCLDARTGKTIWERVYPRRTVNANAAHKYHEYHTTPCIAGGTVVFLGQTGRLYACDAATGEALWEVDSCDLTANWRLAQRYAVANGGKRLNPNLLTNREKLLAAIGGAGGPAGDPAADFDPSYLASERHRTGGSPYGPTFMCSPQIVGTLVVVPAFGRLKAFDLATGKEAWSSVGCNKFGSPLVTAVGKRPVIVNCGLQTVDPRDGKQLGEADFYGGYAPSPAVAGDLVVVRAPLRDPAALKAKVSKGPFPLTCYRITPQGGLEFAWQAPPWTGGWNYCTPAIADGQCYAGVGCEGTVADEFGLAGPRDRRGSWSGLVSIDLATGAVAGVIPTATTGIDPRGVITSFVAGDGRVVLADDKNAVHLFRAGGADFAHLGKLETGFAAFTTPVLVRGILYFREDNRVACYDLRQR